MPKKATVLILLLAAALVAGAGLFFFLSREADWGGQAAGHYHYAIKDPFVTNVKDSPKLFKATIVLVADKKNMEETLDDNQYTVRDTILFMLRDLGEEDIRRGDIQDQLRVSIPEALNAALEIDSIVSVYFSDFVMQ